MLTVSPHTVAYVFGIIFIAELPDKTALASLVLATRYRARDVIIGAWLAFLVQTAVAVEFQNEFVAALALPHKLDPFPHLAGRLPARAAPGGETRGSQRRRAAALIKP